jgi:hypothetical protein
MTKQKSLDADATRVDPLPYLGRARSLGGCADRYVQVVALGLGVQLTLTDAELYKSPLDRAVAAGHRFGERESFILRHTRIPARAPVPLDGAADRSLSGYWKDHIVPLTCGGRDASRISKGRLFPRLGPRTRLAEQHRRSSVPSPRGRIAFNVLTRSEIYWLSIELACRSVYVY